MFLIVGLGNLGKKYINTRHNIGFKAVERFQKENNLPCFQESKKLFSFISKDKEIILLKPQTFMNNSGKAVKQTASFFKIPIQNIIIIHDDLDIDLGKIKISKNCSSAGHKGIESIIKELGTNNFLRIRIGIKPLTKSKEIREKLVLNNFNLRERIKIKKSLNITCQAIKEIIQSSPEKAMSLFNH